MYHAAVHMTLLKWYTGGEINEDREDSNIFISSQFSLPNTVVFRFKEGVRKSKFLA